MKIKKHPLEYDEPTRIMEIIFEDPELYKRWKWYDNIIHERLRKDDNYKPEIKIYPLHPYNKVSSFEFKEYPTRESKNRGKINND